MSQYIHTYIQRARWRLWRLFRAPSLDASIRPVPHYPVLLTSCRASFVMLETATFRRKSRHGSYDSGASKSVHRVSGSSKNCPSTRVAGVKDRVSPRQEPAISSSQSPKTVHVDLAIPARASSLSNRMASGTSASSIARNIREQSESYDAPTVERRAWSLVEGFT